MNYTAKKADKHHLYELAVQCVEADIDFVTKVYEERRGQKPRILREDFCGTAAAAVEFVLRNDKNRAIGLDLDTDVLEWGKKKNLKKLKDRADDVTLFEQDVMSVTEPLSDLILAMNFSYFIFKKREQLKEYYKNVLASLKPGGVFIMDAYGGSEAQVPQFEETEKKGFTYVWDQDSYNPIDNSVVNHIHFLFPDGSKINKAFTYEWRLWTLLEITELLEEVGFVNVGVYWEGWDEEEEEGDGNFEIATVADTCEGWISYIAGEKAEK